MIDFRCSDTIYVNSRRSGVIIAWSWTASKRVTRISRVAFIKTAVRQEGKDEARIFRALLAAFLSAPRHLYPDDRNGACSTSGRRDALCAYVHADNYIIGTVYGERTHTYVYKFLYDLLFVRARIFEKQFS